MLGMISSGCGSGRMAGGGGTCLRVSGATRVSIGTIPKGRRGPTGRLGSRAATTTLSIGDGGAGPGVGGRGRTVLLDKPSCDDVGDGRTVRPELSFSGRTVLLLAPLGDSLTERMDW